MERGTKIALGFVLALVVIFLVVAGVFGILVRQKVLFKAPKVARAEPPPLVKEGIENWKDVLRLTKEKEGYTDFLKKITGLTREDVQRLVKIEKRGADLKIPIPKGTVLTNTGKGYKVYPNFKLPRDRVALTDENQKPKVLTWCGNPIKGVKFPSAEIVIFSLTNLKNGVSFYPHKIESEKNSPDSNIETEIWLLDPAQGEVYPLIKSPADPDAPFPYTLAAGYSQHAAHPALSPNGDFLLFDWVEGGPRGGDFLGLLDFSPEGEGPPEWPWAEPSEEIIPWWLTFSPDGDKLAYVSSLAKGRAQDHFGLNKIYTANLKTGEANQLLAMYTPPQMLEEHTRFDNLHWSPKGNYLAFEAVPLNTDAFLFPIFTMKNDGTDIRRIGVGRSPSWDPAKERLYYLVPAEQEMGEPFNPSLPAYIKSVLPNGRDTRTEVSFKASDGLGTALAVGEEDFYYVSSTNPEEETLDSIVAFDRKRKTKKTLFKAPAGYWIPEIIVAKTTFLEEIKSKAKKAKQEKVSEKETKGKDSYGFGPREGGTEEVMVLKDIRLGENPAFERIVLEFVSQQNNPREGIPRYRARLGNLPYQDSEGNPVSIEGIYYLELVYNGNVADLSVDEAPVIYQGLRDFRPGFSIIKEAKFVPAYENNTLILLIGLDKKAPFKVNELSDPPRITIDFKKE